MRSSKIILLFYSVILSQNTVYYYIHCHAYRHASRVGAHRLRDRAPGRVNGNRVRGAGCPGRDARRQRPVAGVAVGGSVRIPERAERGRPRGLHPGRGTPDARAGGIPGNRPPAPCAQLEEPGRATGRIRLHVRPFTHHPRPLVALD
jgi:hypothetical protein